MNHLTIHRGGRNFQTDHATDVARTFVGSLGMASGVSAIHSFAAQGTQNVDMINAMNWLLQPQRNVRLINVSWGPVVLGGHYSWMDGFVDFHARNNNVTFVVAAGNAGTIPGLEMAMTPALGFNVISVGSTNINGNVSSESAFGQAFGLHTRKPSVVAPGTRLETTLPGPDGRGNFGTSFATPVVSGIIARLMEEFPILRVRPDKVKAILIASATQVNGQAPGAWSNIAGAGRVNYHRARMAARNAVGFENTIRTGSGQTRFSHTVSVTPNSRIRVVAFWMKNSMASYYGPGAKGQLHENIHTNYDLVIRNTSSVSRHASNIEILWHNTTSSQMTIDIVQMANKHVRNLSRDIGAVVWMYEDAFAGGAGTAANPYLIRNATQLDNMRLSPTSHFRLADSINIASLGRWQPIDTFRGTLDGNNFAINQLTMVISATRYNSEQFFGLFGRLYGTVRNLRLNQIHITSAGGQHEGSWVFVGGVVGRVMAGGMISQVTIASGYTDVNRWNARVGGIAGESFGSIADSANSMRIGGVGNLGGIVGANQASGSVLFCVNFGEVTYWHRDARAIGGIVGWNRGAVSSNTNRGNINARNTLNSRASMGTIIGHNEVTAAFNTSNQNFGIQGTANFTSGNGIFIFANSSGRVGRQG